MTNLKPCNPAKETNQKLKLLSAGGVLLLAIASQSFAGDIYRINDCNSLVTANRGDLEVIMALNARHMKQEIVCKPG